jgi:broad specificity phosphatase PhoE
VTTLVLCRHAEVGNDAQARVLAERLSEFAFVAVYTSPLPRALATARVVAEHPIEVEALREIDFGKLDGVPFDDLPEDLREGLLQEPTAVRFPGGESYADLRQRVCSALDAIVRNHPADSVGVITHAGPIRAALAHWLHIADDAVFRLDQRFASVNIVEWIDGVPLVRLVNG